MRAGLRLAATHAIGAARDVTDAMYELGGGSAIYDTNPLQRQMRDVHVATQHMLVAPSTWELAGRSLLGQPLDPSQL
jgi:alkylation response protein AidB-like acyl-CoA dehydrogenase